MPMPRAAPVAVTVRLATSKLRLLIVLPSDHATGDVPDCASLSLSALLDITRSRS
jgi:hypothetical protein